LIKNSNISSTILHYLFYHMNALLHRSLASALDPTLPTLPFGVSLPGKNARFQLFWRHDEYSGQDEE
jgi:hypothetical protein